MGLPFHLVNPLLFGLIAAWNTIDRRNDVVCHIDTIVNLSPCGIFGIVAGVGLILPHPLLPSEVAKGVSTIVTFGIRVGISRLRLLHFVTQQMNPRTHIGGVTQIVGLFDRQIAVAYQEFVKVFPCAHIVCVLRVFFQKVSTRGYQQTECS